MILSKSEATQNLSTFHNSYRAPQRLLNALLLSISRPHGKRNGNGFRPAPQLVHAYFVYCNTWCRQTHASETSHALTSNYQSYAMNWRNNEKIATHGSVVAFFCAASKTIFNKALVPAIRQTDASFFILASTHKANRCPNQETPFRWGFVRISLFDEAVSAESRVEPPRMYMYDGRMRMRNTAVDYMLGVCGVTKTFKPTIHSSAYLSNVQKVHIAKQHLVFISAWTSAHTSDEQQLLPAGMCAVCRVC